MTLRQSGIREAFERLRPWRRRLLQLFGTWFAVLVGAALLGLQPDAAQIGLILLAGAVVVWYATDHATARPRTLWPLTDPVERSQRGADFGVASLASRLQAADLRGEERPAVTRHLHDQLGVIIRERLHAKHGITIEEEPRWAEGVMPRELWDFVTGLPQPDLYSPASLDQVLRRLEQW